MKAGVLLHRDVIHTPIEELWQEFTVPVPMIIEDNDRDLKNVGKAGAPPSTPDVLQVLELEEGSSNNGGASLTPPIALDILLTELSFYKPLTEPQLRELKTVREGKRPDSVSGQLSLSLCAMPPVVD